MNNALRNSIAALGLACASLPAFADQSAWAGFHAEVTAGYFNAKTDNDALYGTSAGGVATKEADVTDASKTTASYGIGAGYGFAMGDGIVLTVGAEYSPQSWDGASFKVNATDAHYTYKNRFNVYVAPGWALDDKTLVYAKIGYTAITAQGKGTNPFDDIGNPSKTLSGVALGAGVKYLVTPSVYLLGELSYSAYQKAKVAGWDTNTNLTDSINTGLTSYAVSVGVGTSF